MSLKRLKATCIVGYKVLRVVGIILKDLQQAYGLVKLFHAFPTLTPANEEFLHD